LLITGAGAAYVEGSSQAKDALRFGSSVQDIHDGIAGRLDTHTAILRATSALFAVERGEVSRDKFRQYVDRLGLEAHYAGIQGVGYVDREPRGREDALIARARGGGDPLFTIWPDSDGPERDVVLFIEPLNERNQLAVGFDMFSEPFRRDAMARARDTGRPAATGAIDLIEDLAVGQKAGFLIYFPVYERGDAPSAAFERDQSLLGFVFGAFRANDLFFGIAPSDPAREVSVEIVDLGPRDRPEAPTRLWAAADSTLPNEAARFQSETTIDVAGRVWKVRFATTPAFEAVSSRRFIPLLLLSGVLLSIALFAATVAQSRARAAAERTAAALERGEEQLRLITDALPVLISYIDRTGTYGFMNATYERWFDRPRSEMTGRPFREVIGETNYAIVREPFDEALRGGKTVTFDVTLRIPATGRRAVRVSYVPHVAASGSALGVVVLVADRTDEKRDEEALQLLAEAGEVLASSLDADVTLTNAANLAVSSLADWCAVEVVQADGTLKQLAVAHVDPAKVELAREYRRRYPTRPDADHGIARVLRTGRSEIIAEITDEMMDAGVEGPEQRRDLRELGIASAMIVPLVARGATFGAMTYISAEPGRKYGPDDLSTAEELARRAAGAIENARLYRDAQEAVRIRDEFMSIASHELKTPLTSLQLQVQHMLRLARRAPRDALPPALGEKLELVARQANRLSKLVEELLEISRLNAGKMALELEEVDLSALVREIVARFGEDIARSGCTVTLDADDGVSGRWDPSRLDQIVTNLVSNALKFGRGGPIEIRVKGDGERAHLVVTDHGIGIAPADQARIFERFERLVSHRQYGGFGVGLWITRKSVQAMNGTIDVESRVGEGTTFTVLLPCEVTQSRVSDPNIRRAS
jgi:PAS domain S-box-containing protein